MSTHLQIAQEEDVWVVLNTTDDKTSKVVINEKIHYDSREELVIQVESRGLQVWSDGTLSRDPDPNPSKEITPEQKKARAEYAKKYRKQMTEEQKERARERARERQKKWREAHPEKAAAYAKRSSERRKERYNTDEQYRAEYREQQRGYAKSRRESE